MKFSIIIPVYNRENFLDKCLNSILKQTYSNYEVIIVNDGSTDNSEKIINKFTKIDNRFKLYNKNNTGVADTRNYGVSKTNGDYILFLDSDDFYETDLLNILNNYTNNQPDLIKFGCQLVDSKGIIKKYEFTHFDNASKTTCLLNLVTDELLDSFCIYAFNTHFYKNNNFKCSVGCLHEDFGLIPYILLVAKSIISIDYIGYNYYLNNNSITNNMEDKNEFKKMTDFIKQYLELVDKINNLNVPQEEKNIMLIYITDTLARKYKKLNKSLRYRVKKKIRKIKIYNNLPNNSLKRLIKKAALRVNVNLYLFITYLGRK